VKIISFNIYYKSNNIIKERGKALAIYKRSNYIAINYILLLISLLYIFKSNLYLLLSIKFIKWLNSKQ
jgi:hypothetical protein